MIALLCAEVWVWWVGVHGPQLRAGGEVQHDEGREVLQDSGGELLECRGQAEGDGQGRDHSPGPLHRAHHVQLLGKEQIETIIMKR